ncbi:hypothetical protein L207DRAFT_515909 [Hyaloscypha variabilis F]|uniref:Uncharacterized protein n=1 Tax=Hyaloscypha variabilis (strain UAMH 11265 / GT02V1 / F) TaxID=1149755 RepID=A0A2J6RCD6_HYAVF|nr:hypothetical protein L207DRAFT_515909 [Hyaloscypha variabilis F]
MALFLLPLSIRPSLRNLSLILLMCFLLPPLTTFTLFSAFLAPWLASTKHIIQTRRWRAISSPTFRARTILVTNLRTPESLSLARTFYRAGHRVIGADYEEYYFPTPAHFSKAVNLFYRLEYVDGNKGRERYMRDLVNIVKKEGVELWVNCSTAGVDLEVRKVLEKETGCQVFQFGKEAMGLLRDEAAFREHIKNLDLKVVEQHLVTSEDEVLSILYPKNNSGLGKQYSITSVTPTDSSNSESALLLSSQNNIRTYIKTLHPSSSNPLLLQEAFPDHQQYTVYALITHGKPAAFVAYPTSATILTPLPSTSLLAQALLKFTTHLTASLLSNQARKSGHLTLHFTLSSNLSLLAESKFGTSSTAITSFLSKIHLLSISPVLDLGTLALRDVSEDLASAYLSILPDHELKGISNGHWEEQIIVPRPGVRGYYFLEGEVVRLVLMPIWGLLRWEVGFREVVRGWIELVGFVLGWREGWLRLGCGRGGKGMKRMVVMKIQLRDELRICHLKGWYTHT